MKRLLIVNTLRENDPAVLTALEILRNGVEEVRVIHTYEKNLRPCIGCNACWLVTPGVCAVKDGYEELLKAYLAYDATVFLSGTALNFVDYRMKNVIDRTLPLVSLPRSWKENAAALLIFSDPAAMGLFFMGAVILLEKSQRVTSFFAVSPLKAWEYVSSKVLSLSTVGLLVAAVLGAAARCSRLPMMLLGTFLSSVLFTLLGLIIASKITSLNQFLLATVPVEILTFLPAALHLLGVTPAVLRLYPANVCMDLIAGRACSAIGLLLTAALIVLLYAAACNSVLNMWTGAGGVRL